MARHGYSDYCDDSNGGLAMWRGQVASAMRGKRGQKFFVDLAAALDAMPEKRLIAGSLQRKDGDCCAIGCIARAKGHDYTQHEEDDEFELEELNADLASVLDIAQCLVQETEYENDEGPYQETPEQRWTRMRKWCDKNIKKPKSVQA